MIAAVTGATGFLGGQLVRQLLERGDEVRCLVRPGSNVEAVQSFTPAIPERLKTFPGTLARPEGWRAAIEGCDVLFHVAAALTGGSSALFLNNVVGTRGLLDLAGGSSVRRLVLVSSIAVYGTSQLRRGALLDERCPLDPEPHRRDPYTYSKVAQEQAAWEVHRQGRLPLVVVRPGVIYGPGRDCLSGRVGLRVGNLVVRMGGRQALPYTFVENCAKAVALAGSTPGVEGQAFNVVDDELPTGRDLLKEYQRSVGKLRVCPVPGWGIGLLSRLCEWYHSWSRGQLPAVLTRYKSGAMWKRLRYSNAKARDVLGWRPQVGYREGVERTLTWLQQHGGMVNTA